MSQSRPSSAPPKPPRHGVDMFKQEINQRYYASPEESDDAIPTFTTPTHMYIREELNPRPRFTSPRTRHSSPYMSQDKYQNNIPHSQKSDTPPKDFDKNTRPKPSNVENHFGGTNTFSNEENIPENAGNNYTSSAPSPSKNDTLLAQLVDMGFDLHEARVALAASPPNTNLQDVLDLLFQNKDQQVPNSSEDPSAKDSSRAKEEKTKAERKQGNLFFNRGQFFEAEESYSKAIDCLPTQHNDLVLLYNNRAAARLKLGRFSACLEDCSHAIAMASRNTTIGASLTEGVSSWKSQWLKALHRKACAFEGMQYHEKAIEVYEEYAHLDGARNSVVTQGILRCQQAKDKKSRPTSGPSWRPADDTTTAFPNIDFNIFVPKQANREEINASKAVREMREREKKREAEEAERLEKSDGVNAQLMTWKSGRERNLRALLGSLDIILWSDIQWKSVTMGELLEPRKCKITYMKAIAKVHPDKLSSTATVEQRLLASGIFTTLNQAWDTFRTENNL